MIFQVILQYSRILENKILIFFKNIFMAGGKVKYSQLSKEEKIKFLGDFYSTVASLQNREEVKNFLKDLLTLSESVCWRVVCR